MFCMDCSKISFGKRCRKCSDIFLRNNRHLHPGYIDGRSFNKKCIICGGKVVSKRRKSVKCKSCCQLGHKVSYKTREKIRIANLGNKNFLGKKHSEKTKAIMRKNRLDYMLSHKGNFTDTNIERILKKKLKDLKFKFVQSHPIKNHIVDFYLPKYNLVIECDGKYWHDKPKQKIKDMKHNKMILSLGIKLLRLKEKLILTNIEKCTNKILGKING